MVGWRSQKTNRNIDIQPSNKITSLSLHDKNYILLKKNDECVNRHDLLGPLGRTWHEEKHRKQTTLKRFIEEVEKIKEKNRKVLTSHKVYLNTLDIDYVDVIEKRERDMEEFLKSKEITYIECKKPLFMRRRLIRSSNDQSDAQFTDMPDSCWTVRKRALDKFIEAARRVLIYKRLLTRLAVLKMMNEENVKIFEVFDTQSNIIK